MTTWAKLTDQPLQTTGCFLACRNAVWPAYALTPPQEPHCAPAKPNGYPNNIEQPVHAPLPAAELRHEPDTDAQCCHHREDPQCRRQHIDHLKRRHEDERPLSLSREGNRRATPRRLNGAGAGPFQSTRSRSARPLARRASYLRGLVVAPCRNSTTSPSAIT